MTEVVNQLTALGEAWLAIAFAVFLRVGAAMALFPAFGERSVDRKSTRLNSSHSSRSRMPSSA